LPAFPRPHSKRRSLAGTSSDLMAGEVVALALCPDHYHLVPQTACDLLLDDALSPHLPLDTPPSECAESRSPVAD
jgi:hypothetical protein